MDDAAHEGVAGFDPRAGDAVLAEVEDLLFDLGHSAGEAFEFAYPAFHRHRDPVAKAFVGALAIGIGPYRLEGVLEQIHCREIAVGSQ